MKKLTITLLVLTALLSVCLNSAEASWTQHGIDWDFEDACDAVAGDFGGEQLPDVAGLNAAGIINIYENDGNQQFITHFVAQVPSNSRVLRAGDMDNDGDLDLIVAPDYSTALLEGILLLINDGNFRFTSRQIEDEYYHYYELRVVDVDNDGDLDLAGVHASSGGDYLTWWENQDNGETFIEHNITNCLDPCFGYADMDEDGDIDFTTGISGDIVWLENTANQVFVIHILGPYPPPYTNDVEPGDLDDDGDLDVIVGNSNGIFWFQNNGDLVFGEMEQLPSAARASRLKIMDVDGDGCTDITGFNWGALDWIENFMCRDYQNWGISQQEVGEFNYDACDMNEDGKIDFVVTGTMTANNIQWYENELNPTVKLQVFPQNTPIIIPPEGGSFDFNVFLWNTTSDTLIQDLWTSLEPEYGPMHPVEPVMLIEGITLMPDTVISRQLTQRVPASLPVDEYGYIVKFGDFPHTCVVQYGFGFYKYPEEDLLFGKEKQIIMDTNVEESVISPIYSDFGLSTAPNPFNAATTISFELQAASQAELTVFDITGRRVWGLGDRVWQAGRHEAIWDAEGMGSGVYFVRLEAGDFMQTVKLLYIK